MALLQSPAVRSRRFAARRRCVRSDNDYGEPGVDYGYHSTREIRVFISSTFHDMQRERELLVKQVFRELRRVCDSGSSP